MLDPPAKLYNIGDYQAHFDARKYMEKYFSETRPDEFEKETVPFTLRTLYQIFCETLSKKFDPNGSRLLELGRGPSFLLSLFASRVFGEIYLATYLESSRNELTRWLNSEQGAFDWNPYLTYIRHKDVGLDDNVLQQVHDKVKGVMDGDVRRDQVLGQSSSFDAVACSLCLETVTDTYAEYQRASKNVINLLKPLGYYVQSGMLNQSYYDGGACYFRTLSTTRQHVVNTLDMNGIELEGWFDFEVPYCGATRTTTSPGTVFYVCYGVKRED